MFKKILVPQDGSELSRGITPWVCQVAKVCGSQADVLFVSPNERTSGLSATLRQRLVEGVAEFHRAGIEAQLKVSDGPAAEVIVSRSEKDGYDLIAMSTHGRSGIGRWVYGSTTDKVVQTTNVPLLLARSTELPETKVQESIDTLVVGLDGSARAESALDSVTYLAKKMAAKVIVVRAIAPLMTAAVGEQAGVSQGDFLLRLREDAEEYVAGVVARLASDEIQSKSMVAVGDAATAIIDRAEEAGISLVAITSHGRTGLKRWILGSVADRVLRASSQPVLLLRAPREVGNAV